MDELGMAFINNQPAAVVNKIRENLQHLLQSPVKNLQHGNEQGKQNMVDNTVFSDADNLEKEEAEEDEEEEYQKQESSAKVIQALLSIVRMLTESGKIQHMVTSGDIQRAAFKGTIFTEKEKMVAARIVNFLRPFIQQRSDDNKLSKPHTLTRAPLVALSNTIATITGFPHLI